MTLEVRASAWVLREHNPVLTSYVFPDFYLSPFPSCPALGFQLRGNTGFRSLKTRRMHTHSPHSVTCVREIAARPRLSLLSLGHFCWEPGGFPKPGFCFSLLIYLLTRVNSPFVFFHSVFNFYQSVFTGVYSVVSNLILLLFCCPKYSSFGLLSFLTSPCPFLSTSGISGYSRLILNFFCFTSGVVDT